MQGVLQFNLFGTAKREGEWFFAHCPPLDITTQGRTPCRSAEQLNGSSPALRN